MRITQQYIDKRCKCKRQHRNQCDRRPCNTANRPCKNRHLTDIHEPSKRRSKKPACQHIDQQAYGKSPEQIRHNHHTCRTGNFYQCTRQHRRQRLHTLNKRLCLATKIYTERRSEQPKLYQRNSQTAVRGIFAFRTLPPGTIH